MSEEKRGRGRPKKVNIDDLNEKKEIYVLKEEVSQLKKENKSLLGQTVKADKLIDVFRAHLAEYPPSISISNEIPKNTGEKTAILVLSDLHYGEISSPEMEQINPVTRDTIIARTDSVVNKFISTCNTIGDIKDVRVLLLGDLLAGNIHDELKEVEKSVIECMFELQTYFVEKLVFITEKLGKTKVVLLAGNHGRIFQKPFNKKKQILNFEFILGKMLQISIEGLHGIPLEIHVPHASYCIVNVNGAKFFISHGDLFGGGSGSYAGLPFYGLISGSSKLYSTLVQKNSKFAFDHIAIGHFHAAAQLPLIIPGTGRDVSPTLFLNPSIIGSSEFSLFRMRQASSTVGAWMIIMDKQGRIDGTILLKPEVK